MKKPLQTARQPSQHEIQPLLNLYNQGRFAEVETQAGRLLNSYPDAFVLHSVISSSYAAQGKFALAVDSFRKVLAVKPDAAEVHFNLAIALSSLGQPEEAIKSYRKAIALMPKFTVAHYNLGTSLQFLGRFDEAAASYRKVVALEPNFFEAHGNLGAVLQAQGKLEEATASYRRALAIYPDAQGYFNLATALRNRGQLDEAIANFHKAIAVKPDYVDAYSNLGEALFHQGRPEEAVDIYQRGLRIAPDHARTNYNLGILLYDGGKLTEAIPYFERSQLDDWQERKLYCLYKTERYAEFKILLQSLVATSQHTSPFLATLSAHYAANFGEPDDYRYCRNPLDFVYHDRIDALTQPDSRLLADLLRDIQQAEISERKQSRLHNGIQSSGNLFKRPEASFKTLSNLVRQAVAAYRDRFNGADCMLMRAFPHDIEFDSSWYVKMRNGGHLTSHIHETGWISGSLYLSIPQQKAGPHDGSIEFSTHGDNYPQLHDDFPRQAIAPVVGDIVMFPSSLFHRTIPFSSNEERICIAFDIKPSLSRVVAGVKAVLLGWVCFAAEAMELMLFPALIL